MKLVKKPVTGMKDILPEEMAIRNEVIGKVREVYGRFGFTEIETPIVEHIENLSSNQGGENEKLIFRILKRGEKLKLDNVKDSSDLTDSGLRYDLTLPLSRFFAANMNELPMPFKALQLGNVFRADRPQRGRFRQFMQCDIDILGDGSILAETELILATTALLNEIGFSGFTVRISDRRILHAMADYSGFRAETHDNLFIILDKMDKIGIEGVKEELLKAGYAEEGVDKCLSLFSLCTEGSISNLELLSGKLGDSLDGAVLSSLKGIMENVDKVRGDGFELKFDPTLVRGMGYYTGTIFEIEAKEFGSSIAGGGRYDGMVGKFLGQEVPSCGLSIGFERIITSLLEKGYDARTQEEKTAFLLEKKLSGERLSDIMKEAMDLRKGGKTVLVTYMAKNKKFQKEKLKQEGYSDIKEFFD